MLRFENYCAQPVELGPDGLPRDITSLSGCPMATDVPDSIAQGKE